MGARWIPFSVQTWGPFSVASSVSVTIPLQYRSWWQTLLTENLFTAYSQNPRPPPWTGRPLGRRKPSRSSICTDVSAEHRFMTDTQTPSTARVVRVIAKFYYTDTGPTRVRHGHGHGLFCGETPLGPCGSVRVRVRVGPVSVSV